MQIEGLPVVPEMTLAQRRSVEPRLTGSGRTRAEVDLGPPGNGRRARDISRSVVHEPNQVGPRGLGAPRLTQGRDVTVGEISRKIGGQILEPGAQAEARIGLAAGARGGNQEKRVRQSARGCHPAVGAPGPQRDPLDSVVTHSTGTSLADTAFTATCGGLTARYTVLHSCAALDSSASAAAAPNGAT